MVAVNRMQLGQFEFAIEHATFRYITQSWSGSGWDFKFGGRYLIESEESTFLFAGVGVFAEVAPLPLAKADDYTGIELDLPGNCDEATGEPYFAIDVGESCETSDFRLRFARRDGSRYLVEISGIASGSIFGHPVRFELSAWAEEQPDHAYPV